MQDVRRCGAVLAVVAGVTLGACGSDDDNDDDGKGDAGALTEVVERVPEGRFPAIYAVDLDAARAALGLTEDADPTEFVDADEAQQRFASAAATAIPHLTRPFRIPVEDALDARQISAAASNGSIGDGVTVLATEQPFDEIADALEDAGYRREGDALTTDEPANEVVYDAVAGGDGFVALSSDISGAGADRVTGAIDGFEPPPAGPERELLAELDGPVRSAIAFEGDCLREIGASDPLGDGDAELVLVTTDEASAEGFAADDLDTPVTTALEFGEPTVDGNRLQVPVSHRVPTTPVTTLLTGEFTEGDLYDCEAE